jgi:hypothetical protein
MAFACGARTGVLAIRMPPLQNTSSNWPLYLPCGRGSGSARHRPPHEAEVACLLGDPRAGGVG